MNTDIEELKNKTITGVEKIDNEEIIFTTTEGKKYRMYHSQECCENVYIEDICGDLEDLVGSPLLQAEEATSGEHPEGVKPEYNDDSFTWTFYRFATMKGSVVIRWYGSSNGYYSESVNITEIK